MISVYYKKKDDSLGKFEVDSKSHVEAIKEVEAHLQESIEIFKKPVLAVIPKQQRKEETFEKELA